MFSVRIVTADYYLASPVKDLDVTHSSFRESDVKKVPVVRIFGATPAGQKTCLHLHGIFPYIYVPYDGCGQPAERHMRQVAFSIDRALNVSMGNPASSAQHVFKVVLVSGMPFYGFHAKEKHFMKIYLYNPQMVKRVCELLQSGAVMNKNYQPHEGHIPYLLQLFIDYNLYGMNLVNLAAVKFRRGSNRETADPDRSGPSVRPSVSPWKSPCNSKLNDSTLGGTFIRWEESALPSSLVLDEVERQSTCELEVDAVAVDILNRLEIENQIGRNPGLQAIWEDEKQRRREKDESSQIEAPESQDRGFVTSTDSERVFLKRLKDILTENQFEVTQDQSLDDEQEEIPVELTLHPDPLTPDGLPLTPAFAVEEHRVQRPDSARNNVKDPAEAVVDEEAILDLLESSQTFQPRSRASNHSPVFDSRDHAIIDLLASLQDDGLHQSAVGQTPQHRSLPVTRSYQYNSDEEEAEPEISKEEAELSVLMSQRWDDNPMERSPRLGAKGAEDGLSDDPHDCSDEEMEWSGSSSLFADLSIPQLDGAADESSDSSLTDSGSMSQSSLAVTEKMLGQRNHVHLDLPSPAETRLDRTRLEQDSEQSLDKHFHLKSSQINSSECSAGFQVSKEIPYIQPVKHPILSKTANHAKGNPPDKEDIQPFYPYDNKASIPLDKADLEGFPFISEKDTKTKMEYSNMKRVESSCLTLLQTHRNFLSLSELRNCRTEMDLSSMDDENTDSPSDLEGAFVEPQKEISQESEEGDVGELKICYEDYQENKTEKTVVACQEAHYKFFPSVILSNCLGKRKAGNKKPTETCPNPESPPLQKSKLKASKKRLGMAGQRSKTKPVFGSTVTSSSDADLPSSETIVEPLEKEEAKASAHELETIEKEEPEDDKSSAKDQAESVPEDLVSSSNTETCSFEEPQNSQNTITLDLELAAKVTCAKPSALPGSKYSLRTKRKKKYSGVDGERPDFSRSKNPTTVTEAPRGSGSLSGLQGKVQKKQKKEPPVIIKYIIINRFKGQKNMLVKMSKVNLEGQSVLLTPKKLEEFGRAAPFKNFWPKVPKSPAMEFPVAEPKAKKQPKRKVSNPNKKTPPNPPKARSKQTPGAKGAKGARGCRRGLVLPSLPPPRPCYCELAEDHSEDYSDVMVELGYLSDRSSSPIDSTPPRCWSPSDPLMFNNSSEPLKDPLSDPCLSSASHKPRKATPSKGTPRKPGRPRSSLKTQRNASPAAGKPEKPKKENPKISQGVVARQKKKSEGKPKSPKTAAKPRGRRKSKTAALENSDLSKDDSQLLFPEDEPLPSETSSEELPPFQGPAGSSGTVQTTPVSESSSESQMIKPKVENCETAISEKSQSVLELIETEQRGCQTVAVKTEASQDNASVSSDHSQEHKPEVTPNPGPKNGEASSLVEAPSGLVVLKQLLQKRQQKKALPTQTVGTESSSPALSPAAASQNPTPKPSKSKRGPNGTPRKTRTPKEKGQESKNKKSKKGRLSSTQPNPTTKQEDSLSDDCPLFLSDPEQDNCNCLGDNLSAELPNNYTFDINDIHRTDFSSPYSGSQFVLTDKNLPVKFLSDINQEAVLAQVPGFEDNPNNHSQGALQKLLDGLKSRPGSPDLFEKFEKRHSASAPERRRAIDKSSVLSPFQDFHCEKKELLFSAVDPVPHPPLSSVSFVDHDASPTSDLQDGIDGLTSTTPSSSPRSSSSSLSQARASQLQRGSGAGAHILKPLMSPPSREEIISTLPELEMSETTFQEPFCSDPADAPGKPMEVGGRKLMLETRLAKQLPEFSSDLSLEGLRFWKTAFLAMTRPAAAVNTSTQGSETVQAETGQSSDTNKKAVLLPCRNPPTRECVQLWLEARKQYESLRSRKRDINAAVTEQPAAPGLSSSQNRTQRRRKLNLSLIVAPVASSGGSVETTPVSEEGSVEDGEAKSTSPDSPDLPPWQPSRLQSSPDEPSEPKPNTTQIQPPSPGLANSQKTPIRVNTPFSLRVNNMELDGTSTSPNLLSCTPFSRKRRRSEDDQDPVCSTPISDADPVAQKLQQRRRSQADPLRRVLLTTQMKNQFAALNVPKKDHSQIEGPSISNSYGFKVSMQNLQDAKALHEVQHLTLMAMELHARTRRDLEPDPEFDPICALFYCFTSDAKLPDVDGVQLTGTIVVDKASGSSEQGSKRKAPLLVRSGVSGLQVSYVTEEKMLLQELVTIMRRFDPDILVGYEVQMHSWGYLLQRAAVLGVDLCQQLSRVPGDSKENRFAAEKDEYGADTMTEIHVIGRVTLNLWRVMKSEVALNSYSFENVAFHVLHQRFPLFSHRTLSDWFDHNTDLYRWKMVDHYVSRVRATMQLLQQNDIVGRTSELARLFGIQFLHVLTRGSQYRVESMMLRVAKPLNYIPVTPSVQQRAQQRAPQCIPLVMEPESRFYSNSVLVLDFQSLYPSIVIAYNYCFSTCLGRVEQLGTPDEFKFGCTSLRVPPELLYQLRNDITVSPSGIAFVKASVRRGVLPRMLEEILSTRIMVKQSMKAYKQDRALTKLLDARQLGLKLIANVTFGYTSANYSGRMPSVEVGDSIVHKARETLERAIRLVNDTKKWGARVVYGDTDSMFVLLRGATKEQAFKIGSEIAEAVTATNPKPVKLKFEKVYLPCVLQTKKRYVGYMYESLDQKEPVFDAKGIETVRRDGCPAVAKILERSIKLLFETRDVSQVKRFVQHQCLKVLDGRASMQDLTFAKEYRGSGSYRPGACVPALELSRRMTSYDRRLEPRVGERVPYVVVYGSPGVPLIQLVRRPLEVLQDPGLRLNATYYISKQILPPLARMFQLIGVDVFGWYQELPRVQKASCAAATAPGDEPGRKGTISQYFTTLHCPVCDELTQLGVCARCRAEPQRVAVTLHQDMRAWESQQEQLLRICRSCSGGAERPVPCVSLDCPVLYKLSRVSRQISKAPYLRQLLDQF